MAINGSRSTFPTTLDAWGTEFENDICTPITAERWNRIQDAVYRIEGHSLKTILTGEVGSITHTTSGDLRPKVLFKSYTVTLTGSASVTKTMLLSGFTAGEKDLFNGTPLASGNAVHVQIRKAAGDGYAERAYHASVLPIDPSNTSGDAGWLVSASNLRHGNNQTTIDGGIEVVVSVWIDGT